MIDIVNQNFITKPEMCHIGDRDFFVSHLIRQTVTTFPLDALRPHAPPFLLCPFSLSSLLFSSLLPSSSCHVLCTPWHGSRFPSLPLAHRRFLNGSLASWFGFFSLSFFFLYQYFFPCQHQQGGPQFVRSIRTLDTGPLLTLVV